MRNDQALTTQQRREEQFEALDPPYKKSFALWRINGEITPELGTLLEMLQEDRQYAPGDPRLDELYARQAEYIQVHIQQSVLAIGSSEYVIGVLINYAEQRPAIYLSLKYDSVQQWLTAVGIDPQLVFRSAMRVAVWNYIQCLNPDKELSFVDFIQYSIDKIKWLYGEYRAMDARIKAIRGEIAQEVKAQLPSGQKLTRQQEDDITLQAQQEYRPNALKKVFDLKDRPLGDVVRDRMQKAGITETPYLLVNLKLTPEGTGYFGHITGGRLDLTNYATLSALARGQCRVEFLLEGQRYTISGLGDELLMRTEPPRQEDEEEDMPY